MLRLRNRRNAAALIYPVPFTCFGFGADVNMKRILNLIVVFVTIISVTAGCTRTVEEPFISKNGFYFDTVVKLTLYGNYSQEILDNCFSLCEKYEHIFSASLSDSELSILNSSGKQDNIVSEDLYRLISEAHKICNESEGAYDITLRPVTALWNFRDGSCTVPALEDIENALRKVDYRNIDTGFDGSSYHVYFDNPEIQIEAGSCAKGFIADRLYEYLQSVNVSSALIDLGGNIMCVGGKAHSMDYGKEKSNTEAFTIGISSAGVYESSTVCNVKITDKSVVSSGTNQRCFEKNGKLYHHLLNSKTGYPIENGLAQVTVIADSSFEADIFSTACFALGEEESLELLRKHNISAMFLYNDGRISYCNDFEAYIQ